MTPGSWVGISPLSRHLKRWFVHWWCVKQALRPSDKMLLKLRFESLTPMKQGHSPVRWMAGRFLSDNAMGANCKDDIFGPDFFGIWTCSKLMKTEPTKRFLRWKQRLQHQQVCCLFGLWSLGEFFVGQSFQLWIGFPYQFKIPFQTKPVFLLGQQGWRKKPETSTRSCKFIKVILNSSTRNQEHKGTQAPV